jgi:ferredoxin-NADP reductase
VVDVRNETEDSATVTIKPGWGFSAGVKPGTIVRLAAAKGDFALPDPPPPKILFVSAGSGITPLMAMLRTLKASGHHTDIVHVHSAPSADAVIFHDELREMESTQPGYRLHLQLTQTDGKLEFEHLDDLAPDWRERPTWACGPAAMLDAVEAVWDGAGLRDDLHTERFTIARTDKGGEAGEKVGIQMPFGCRMGICHACVLPPGIGLRQGLPFRRRTRGGRRINTCVSTASGDCTLKI